MCCKNYNLRVAKVANNVSGCSIPSEIRPYILLEEAHVDPRGTDLSGDFSDLVRNNFSQVPLTQSGQEDAGDEEVDNDAKEEDESMTMIKVMTTAGLTKIRPHLLVLIPASQTNSPLTPSTTMSEATKVLAKTAVTMMTAMIRLRAVFYWPCCLALS